MDERVAACGARAFIRDVSTSLGMARVAAGDAECVICTNPRVSKWDSAAGQAILEAVGGVVTDARGRALEYAQPGREWEHLVAASANPIIHSAFIAAIQSETP